jgi:hypothetical protein
MIKTQIRNKIWVFFENEISQNSEIRIEVGDSKRKIVCIHFSHLQRKMALVEAFHGAAMADLKLHGPAMVSSPRRGKGGRGEEQGWDTTACGGAGKGAPWQSCTRSGAWFLLLASCTCSFSIAFVRKRRKKREGKRKKEIGKISKHGNFWEEK